MKPGRVVLLERFRLVAAVLVVALHCNLLGDAFFGGFLLPDGLARLAVPYFATLTGYFTGERAVSEGPGVLKAWCRSVLKIYGILFLLYAPFFLWQLADFVKQPGASPLVIARFVVDRLFFNGSAYHLWYLPQIVYGLVIAVLLVRSFRQTLVPLAVSVAVYVAVCMGATWGWVWPSQPMGTPQAISNGLSDFRFLFYLLPFLLGGIAVRQSGERFTEGSAFLGLILGSVALVAETFVVHAHGGRPETMVSLLVVTLCGFRVLTSRAERAASPSKAPLGKLSNLVYYLHLFPILVLTAVTRAHPLGTLANFGIALLATAAMVAVVMRTRLAKVLA